VRRLVKVDGCCWPAPGFPRYPERGDMGFQEKNPSLGLTGAYSAISRMAQRTKVAGEPGTYYRALSAGYSPEQDPAARNYVALLAGFRSTLKLRGTPIRSDSRVPRPASFCAPAIRRSEAPSGRLTMRVMGRLPVARCLVRGGIATPRPRYRSGPVGLSQRWAVLLRRRM
jgi:hypothetical protein